MYEFLDRPVTGLDNGGRFLVWSMRTWVGAAGAKTCPASRPRAAVFALADVAGAPAVPADDGFVQSLRPGEISFCALRCNHVSEHEAIILSLLCSLHEGHPERLPATLALLVDEDGVLRTGRCAGVAGTGDGCGGNLSAPTACRTAA